MAPRYVLVRTAAWLLLFDTDTGACERAYTHDELDRALVVAERLDARAAGGRVLAGVTG